MTKVVTMIVIVRAALRSFARDIWKNLWGPFIKDLEVDDNFEVNEGMEVDDLALPEEVQLIFTYRKWRWN